MERLTIDEIIEHCDRKTEMYEKACDVKYLETTTMNNPIKEYWEHKQVAEYLRKLKAYEDLEEQGRLVVLPCKVGDTVYCIFNRYTKCTFNNEEFDEYSCQGCEYECDSKKENYAEDMRAYSLDWIVTNLKKFGKTVFLAKSEAEAKLKELKGGENESSNS